jgi:hypothetical protein
VGADRLADDLPHLAALYLRKAKRHGRPILDLTLLRYPTFRASLLGGTLVRLGIGASPFLMPLLLQVALGWSPLKASVVTLATGVGVLSPAPSPGRPQAFRLPHLAGGLRQPDGDLHRRAGLLHPPRRCG